MDWGVWKTSVEAAVKLGRPTGIDSLLGCVSPTSVSTFSTASSIIYAVVRVRTPLKRSPTNDGPGAENQSGIAFPAGEACRGLIREASPRWGDPADGGNYVNGKFSSSDLQKMRAGPELDFWPADSVRLTSLRELSAFLFLLYFRKKECVHANKRVTEVHLEQEKCKGNAFSLTSQWNSSTYISRQFRATRNH